MRMLSLLPLCLGFARAQSPDWRPVPAWEYEPIYSVSASGDTLWAGTEKGIRRSVDGGESWTDAGKGLGEFRVECLARSGGNLVAAQWRSLYISSDGGDSWTVRDSLDGGGFLRLFGREDTLFAYHALFGGPEPDGLRISTDRGLTWKEFPLEPMGGIAPLAFQGDSFTVSGSGLRRKTGTDTAEVLSVPEGISQLEAAPSRLLVVSRNGICQASIDRGATWSIVRAGTRTAEIRGLAAEGATLAFQTPRGIYLSGNGGREWRFAGLNRYAADSQRLHLSAGRLFVSASGRTVLYRYDIAQSSWDATILPDTIGAFAAAGGTAVFDTPKAKLYLSRDGGTFRSLPVTRPPSGIWPGSLLAIARSGYFLMSLWSMSVSADSGLTWTSICTNSMKSLAATDSAAFYTDPGDRLWRIGQAKDRSCSREPVSLPPGASGPLPPTQNAFLAGDRGTLYYGTPRGVFAWEMNPPPTRIIPAHSRNRARAASRSLPVRAWRRPVHDLADGPPEALDAKGAVRTGG